MSWLGIGECRPAHGRQEVRADTGGDPGGGGFDRIPGQMGIPLRRLDLSVAEELPDHRKALPESKSSRGERVAQVVIVDAWNYSTPSPMRIGAHSWALA